MIPIFIIMAFFSYAEAADDTTYLSTLQWNALQWSPLVFGVYWLSVTLRPNLGPNKYGPGLQ